MTVTPTTVMLPAHGTQQFVASVTGAADTRVTWKVDEPRGVGGVDSSGLYTAPGLAGTYHVVVTSVADGSRSARATVHVPAAGGPPKPMPVISRNAPAFASSGTDAGAANDDDYHSVWRSSGSTPVWIAYDISRVPAAERGLAVVAWYADTLDLSYVDRGDHYAGLPQLYTIDAHAAPGGGSPPPEGDPGWVRLAEATSPNAHSSRQHVVNLTEQTTVYNWIRMRVTSISSAAGNADIALNLDVHDAQRGIEDDWIFFGDSITAAGLSHEPRGDLCFSQIIQASSPAFFPAQQDGGVSGWSSPDAVANVPRWLDEFSGRYVGLSFGTNDASWVTPDQFYANYETLVQAVIRAGKTPVVPTIPWNRRPSAGNIPALNAKLATLSAVYPQIVNGPDLWAFFQNNQSLISNDDTHPTEAGFVAYRRLWAEAMLAGVYR